MTTIEKIFNLINEQKITAAQLAKEANLNPALLTQWKQKKQKPSTEALTKIADYFNVSVDYLLGRSDKPTPEKPTLNPRPDLVIPDILQQVGIGFNKGAENLTQEDIDDMAFALELRRKRK